MKNTSWKGAERRSQHHHCTQRPSNALRRPAERRGCERPCPACWAITMPDSPSAPTPTLRGRSRTRLPRPWAPLWSKSCKKKRHKKEKAHWAGSKTSYPVRFKPFRTFRRVGRGVGHNFFGIPKTHFLQQKTPKIRRFQVFSGAAGRI